MAFHVTVVGSGNWGTAIARVVGENVKKHKRFNEHVTMWVYEELVNGEKLSQIINEKHENVKYLPGRIISDNVKAEPDLVAAVKDADILVFVVPHQFIDGICHEIAGKIKTSALAVSLVKPRAVFLPYSKDDEGVEVRKEGGIKLISRVIQETLNCDVAVLQGAMLAREVAAGKFCEATIGCKSIHRYGPILKNLFQTENFRVVVVDDPFTVEFCGALKNVVACGAGFVDGLNYGNNTKAAIIRLGLMEMTKFVECFYPGSNLQTFFESCGVADLITTCFVKGGKNRRCCEEFVRAKGTKSMEQIERELLKDQALQGPRTAEQVYKMLDERSMTGQFPLFKAVHEICDGQEPPEEIVECLRNHPEHRQFANMLRRFSVL